MRRRAALLTLGAGLLLSLSACRVAGELPDGCCAAGFFQLNDTTCGSGPGAGCGEVGDAGCFLRCSVDGDCPSGTRCSVQGLYAGGDFICNATALVCRSAPDDCARP